MGEALGEGERLDIRRIWDFQESERHPLTSSSSLEVDSFKREGGRCGLGGLI